MFLKDVVQCQVWWKLWRWLSVAFLIVHLVVIQCLVVIECEWDLKEWKVDIGEVEVAILVEKVLMFVQGKLPPKGLEHPIPIGQFSPLFE
jgi:hypothetical protein